MEENNEAVKETGGEQAGEETQKGAEDLSFDEVLKKKEYQSEFDKRVTKALETAKTKWQDEAFKIAAEEKRIAALSAEEKAAEALKKAVLRAEELEKEKKGIILKQDTKDLLIEKNIPPKFSDWLMGEDAETTKANVDAFEKAFSAGVEAAVEERLKGRSPKKGEGERVVSRDEFLKLSTAEQLKIKMENPEVFHELIKR